jgi:2-keto-4-pentenoate hydratase/2-oxohepta-3-ene-1,7-dioic acid hydratase in catechol pathway
LGQRALAQLRNDQLKLATFAIDGKPTWGAIDHDEAVDVGAVLGAKYSGLRALLAADAVEEVRGALSSAPRVALDAIAWLPVIPDPAKILCIGLNYETHRKETGRDATAHPAVFTRFADTQIGHGVDIVRPHVSTWLDFEGELAIVIGKPGRYILREQAMSHIAGYACYNDATIRDWQRHTIQFTPGKNFPATAPFGPWMVTADEIADITRLRITTRLNDLVVQDAGFDQLIFPIDALIAYCSAFTPLAAGDVIATGTPGGVGFKREPMLFMKPGDRVIVDIPGIGSLTNGIVDERMDATGTDSAAVRERSVAMLL